MRWRTISRLSGILILIIGLAMISAVVWALIDGDSISIKGFVSSIAVTLVFGSALFAFGKKPDTISIREAIFIVASGWILAGIFGGLPYFFTGTFDNVIDCFFETVSGFTTTGSTVMTDIEGNSRAILFWRSLTQWLGGMGIIVLFIAVLPRIGMGAKKLFESEVPGPITSSFRPKLKETSSILWKIYLGLTAAELILLMIFDVGFYDSICHSLTTMATGGFSTKAASIAHYNSVGVDIVVTIFMFFAGINFYLYYLAVRGNFKTFYKDVEFKFYAGIIIVCTTLITFDILLVHPDFWHALRIAVFQTVSIGTTTGFGTDDFNLYPSFSKTLLVMLMFIGGSAGSTAGGMKVSRLIVLLKSIKDELIKASHPHIVRAVKIGGHTIPKEVRQGILVFFAMVMSIFAFGTLVMTSMGLDLITSATAVAATFFNIGPGLERVGSIENFAFLSPFGKLFLSFLMILGRLELVTVLTVLLPHFWRR
ncbi:MAG: TrkH family potassium uptake protein [candidate division Zixibacteria bacterium]